MSESGINKGTLIELTKQLIGLITGFIINQNSIIS
jgi:hypothetical protein